MDSPMPRDSVPLLWPGRTVFIIGAGPSLYDMDLTPLRAQPTIAINRMAEVYPWASMLYFSDDRVLRWYRDMVLRFPGVKICGQSRRKVDHPDIINLKRGAKKGLSKNPKVYCHGNNSGYAAINVAYLAGAMRIVLLGFDQKRDDRDRDHCHPDHPVVNRPKVYDKTLPWFETLVDPLTHEGVEVLNCTPDSALRCFPKVPLGAVLEDLDMAAQSGVDIEYVF